MADRTPPLAVVRQLALAGGLGLALLSGVAVAQTGTDGPDSLQGGDGADVIAGGTGDDTIAGRGGDDRLDGGSGADAISGGPGDDTLRAAGDDRTIMTGDSGDDDIAVEQGRGIVDGGSGNDSIRGGEGADSLTGGADDDRISGRDGSDGISGASGTDHLFGGAGSDRIDGGLGQDLIDGGRGNDNLVSIDGQPDRVVCGSGRDVVRADGGDLVARDCEVVVSRAGSFGKRPDTTRRPALDLSAFPTTSGTLTDDRFQGGDPAELIDGSLGDDTLLGGDGGDLLEGGPGEDALSGEAGADVVNGAVGSDFAAGGEGDDSLNGGAAPDALHGGAGGDGISGGSGNDTLYGDEGDDRIEGGLGKDRVLAGAGGDNIVAADGQVDEIGCGPGRDVVRMDAEDRVWGDCELVIARRGDRYVVTRRSGRSNAGWSPPTDILGPELTPRISHPTLAAGPGGTVLAAFVGPKAPGSFEQRPYLAARAAGGGFDAPVPLAEGAPSHLAPSLQGLAIGATGRGLIMWTQQPRDGSPAGLHARVREADGALGPLEEVPTGGRAVDRATVVATPDGGFVAGLQTSEQSQFGPVRRAWWLVRTPAGEWQGPFPLSPGGEYGGGITLAANDEGGVLAVWTEIDPGARRSAQRAAYRPPGGSFSEPEAVPLRSEIRHVAAAAGGEALAVEEQVVPAGGGGTGVLVATTRSANGEWSRPQTISPAGVQQSAMAMNEAGGAILLYIRQVERRRRRVGELRAIVWRGPDRGWGRSSSVARYRLEAEEAFAWFPALGFADDGTAVAVWPGSESEESAIQAAVRPPGGDFGRPTAISGPRAGRPSLAVLSSGGAVAAWQHAFDGAVTAAGYEPR